MGLVAGPVFDCSDPESKAAGLLAALEAIRAGQSIVLPTDTVYGIGCDAFSPPAVAGLLAAKGRGRHMPPPVLVAKPSDVEGLVAHIPESAGAVMREFWPGGVTIIFSAHPSVVWDLGETQGTVAIRMPADDLALELLELTGPLAVSSANLTGGLPAVNVEEAREQLGSRVAVYLDGGPVGQLYADATGNPGSTIVDASALETGGPWRVIRRGVVPVEEIRAIAKGEWEL
jgi:L-threonylcarbamoyladenylate synthase